jgi:Kef-type K+ transport system membrane component KefB/Trk K+ transport system NAD-binding subunit
LEHTPSYIPLLLVLALAFAVPVLLRRFRRFGIPIVVGEIVAGIIVGRSGLGIVPYDNALLTLLAEFGFVFLMFLAGLEVDFGALRAASANRGETRRLGPVQLGLVTFPLTLLLATGVGLLLVQLGLARNPWMMALILSTTSLGVVMPVLKERGLSGGPLGQSILLAALIADFGTMLLITVLVAAVSRGLTLDILVIGLLFVAFVFVVRLGLFTNRRSGVRRVIEDLSHATAQIKVRFAFTLMLAFVVLSQALGTEIILGAFLAGAVLSLLRTPEDERLSNQLEAIGFGFFIPLFFIQVGLAFDLSALLASPSAALLVPVLVAAAVAVKLIPSLLFRTVFPWRETLAAGALLSARLSLIIAASAVGLRLGMISEPVNAAIILVAIVTVTFAPLVFNRLAPSRSVAGRKAVLIFGAGELGLQLAQHLAEHRQEVVLGDPDEKAVARARQHGREALEMAPGHVADHATALISAADAVVCAHADADTNYAFCAMARTQCGAANVLANVIDPADAGRFRELGAMPLTPLLDRVALLALCARNPSIYALLTRANADKEVWEIRVENQACARTPLRALALPGDVLVLALRREEDYLVPHGETRLELRDVVTLIGSAEWMEPTRALFAANGRMAGRARS